MKRERLKKKQKTSNSTKWMERHINDEYVIKSKSEGYRSRSSYKLLEIEKKFSVFKKCNSVLDLGCAPGGWLQIAKQRMPNKSLIVGIDKLNIEKINGIEFIQRDIFDPRINDFLLQRFDKKFNLLMSDMSPNSTGNKSVDHLRIVSLVERVLELAKIILKSDGFLISKIFQGGAQGELINLMKKDLNNIKYFKPKSSRNTSPETYLIAKKN